jgi:hypothetical protein
MANNVILLGAGFSRNWGAPLAREVAGSLIQSVGDEGYLEALLRRHDENFETALTEVQQDYSSTRSADAKVRLDRLQAALVDVFEAINAALSSQDFDFPTAEGYPVVEYSVRRFLSRFDAIFTLNQDLLLELHYCDQVTLASNARWNSAFPPGVTQVYDPTFDHFKPYTRRWMPTDPPYRLEPRVQPYFKVHGSSGWYTRDGRLLIIAGGEKARAISEHQLLTWYMDQFINYLSRPDTRLIVIGYGFADEHINAAIIDAPQPRRAVGKAAPGHVCG